ILTSKTTIEGERKQVTVMFTDVSGFTALSERLDPEEVHSIMDRAFEVILRAVHGFEGTINQFLGDGAMALFGAPIAHEDHAGRALRAALAIQEALEPLQADVQPAHAVKGEIRGRTRLEVSRERGLTPLAGRRAERQQLAAAFDKSCAGSGSVVVLTGDAGVGKSRLLYEFLRSVEASGHLELETT